MSQEIKVNFLLFVKRDVCIILLNLEKNLLSICQIILGNASNSVQGGKKENSSSCSQSGKPIVSAIINMPVSEAI